MSVVSMMSKITVGQQQQSNELLVIRTGYGWTRSMRKGIHADLKIADKGRRRHMEEMNKQNDSGQDTQPQPLASEASRT